MISNNKRREIHGLDLWVRTEAVSGFSRFSNNRYHIYVIFGCKDRFINLSESPVVAHKLVGSNIKYKRRSKNGTTLTAWERHLIEAYKLVDDFDYFTEKVCGNDHWGKLNKKHLLAKIPKFKATLMQKILTEE